MEKKISVANLIQLIGAAVTFLFSFFAFFKFGNQSLSAWSGDGGAFATTVPAILAAATIVVSILELTGQKLPGQVLTFNWNQIKATWGIGAAGIMISWLLTSPGAGDSDKGIGFWFMLLGSIAMAVGAIMALLGKGSEIVGGGSARASTTTGAPPPPPVYGTGSAPPPPGPGAPSPPTFGTGGAPPPPPPT
jgi:hypothetical protein